MGHKCYLTAVLQCGPLLTGITTIELQATMSDNFRDTVFGQLVRLLSKKKLLKFPDEIDQNLWEK